MKTRLMKMESGLFANFLVSGLVLALSVAYPVRILADDAVMEHSVEAGGGERAVSPSIKLAIGTPPSARDWSARHGLYYKRNWGVDVLGVHPVSSGQMLAFRYRVLDTEKAKALFDKTSRPYLIDETTGTRLAVPAMENVGELRQSVTPEVERTYFMIFGNPGKLVKLGSRVSIVVGSFYIDGIVVD